MVMDLEDAPASAPAPPAPPTQAAGSVPPTGIQPGPGHVIADHIVADIRPLHDGDSAIEIPIESTASLRDSILEFQRENGRTYHSLSAGKYGLPNDERESERLDILHALNLLTFNGRLALCPKDSGARRVLDMGTGTGIWAMDYADAHPEAEVIGVDLSPIQPILVPPNLRFEIDDLENDWTWSQRFDFIFCRSLVGSFTDWNSIIQKAYDHLEPGGWLEIQDGYFPIGSDDGTLPANSSLLRCCQLSVEAGDNLGRNMNAIINQCGSKMRDVGFVNCVERRFKWPINTWPKDRRYKELGMFALAALDSGIEGMLMGMLTRGLGWEMEQVLAFATAVRKEMRDPRIHAYWPLQVTYGQKPY
ncbi:S-adenosyl-L-methionine-dependent methyltransferase [Plectosphaerella plurivora]|uniref:S-adenosyl-L-methionine-dependent methyltransferase n=1 Tax=Plectosphaerella plurivora TaxID=936078 RepID=A0A9P8VGW5_9PEZI|nr:S-adenosyl-L-methionine-dependent methyltransferase [Plectosphaerella plurivora]